MFQKEWEENIQSLDEAISIHKEISDKNAHIKKIEPEIDSYIYRHSPKKPSFWVCARCTLAFVTLVIMTAVFTSNGQLSETEGTFFYIACALLFVLSVFLIARMATYKKRDANHKEKRLKRLNDIANSRIKGRAKERKTAEVYKTYSELQEQIKELDVHFNKMCALLNIPKCYRKIKYLKSARDELLAKGKDGVDESTEKWFNDYFELISFKSENKKSSDYESLLNSKMKESLYYKKQYDKYYREYMGYPPKEDKSALDLLRSIEEDHMTDFAHDIDAGGDA